MTSFRLGHQSKVSGRRWYGGYLNPAFVDVHQWASDWRQEWGYFEHCWVDVQNGWPNA